jgi:hypothetical protein
MKRYNFTTRRGTTVCQKPPLDYASKIVKFIQYVARIRERYKYDHIYACDETAVWLDASGGKTIEERGAKEVGAITNFSFCSTNIFRCQFSRRVTTRRGSR